MLAPEKGSPPGGAAGLKGTQAVESMQGDDDAAKQAVAAVVSELPAPPYPGKIGNKVNKAGGFKFELDIERMRQSDTWAIAEAHQRPFLVMVWIESWTLVPCGTLPDDDAVIARRIGLKLSDFKDAKDVLLRGWQKCSDGRLYHKVITEQVLAMMDKKARHAKNQANYRERKKDEPATDSEVTVHFGVTDYTYQIPPTTSSKDQSSLRSDSSSATPSDQSAETSEEKVRKSEAMAARTVRLAQVTRDAIETFNVSTLTKANGGLVPNVDPEIGMEKRQKQVAKCLAVARAICRKDYESEIIVREFWVDYWEVCHDDDHKSGRIGGGKGHGNWVPTFEYLTREATMLEIYDRVASASSA